MTKRILPSATGLGSPVEVDVKGDIVYLTSWSGESSNRAWSNPSRHELLEALRAVRKEGLVAVQGALAKAREERDDATDRAEAAEAKLARAEATLLRALKALDSIDTSRTRKMAEMHHYEAGLVAAADKIRAAILNPPKPFELPTVPGVAILADGHKGVTYEFRLFSDGTWIDDCGNRWTAEKVLDRFTDHRLIGEA